MAGWQSVRGSCSLSHLARPESVMAMTPKTKTMTMMTTMMDRARRIEWLQRQSIKWMIDGSIVGAKVLSRIERAERSHASVAVSSSGTEGVGSWFLFRRR